MRKVEYRAWYVGDKDLKPFMIYEPQIKVMNMRPYNDIGFKTDMEFTTGKIKLNDIFRHPERCIYMQWTGLLDIKGRKIFEWDIVLDSLVEWDEKLAMWNIPRRQDESLRDDYKVQGNILENPELVK